MTPLSASLVEEVSSLIRRVADREIMPRFRQLRAGDVREKSEDDLVTAADLAAESALFEGLGEILPQASLVGEETCEEDRALLSVLSEPGLVWVVDPLDGTTYFANGEEPFGCAVALLEDGETQAAWIYLPIENQMAIARRGAGVHLDGRRPQLASAASDLRGALLTRFLPKELRERVEQAAHGLDLVANERCATKRYVEMLAGIESFALYYRTLPWDHAAGVLLVEESGGLARRFDGSRYAPCDEKSGLLVATSDELWSELHARLLQLDD